MIQRTWTNGRLLVLSGLVFGLGLGCVSNEAEGAPPVPKSQPASNKAALVELSPRAQAGKPLYAVCQTCHDPSLDPPRGPPMFGVQRWYRRAEPTKEGFVARMVDFVRYPSREKALMRHPVERLGLMVAMPLDAEVLEKIATYIFEERFSPPCAHWKNAIRDGDAHGPGPKRMLEKFCR